MVEALLALSLSAILAAALLSILLSQGRFYQRSQQAIVARQSIGAALDLVAAELRMARPSDILSAAQDSISVRWDVMHGVVCDSMTADAVNVFWYDSVAGANLPGGLFGTAVADPGVGDSRYADGWTPTPAEVGAGPRATCTAAGAPSGSPDPAYRRLSGWSAAFPAVPPSRGSLVRRYGTLTYRLAPSRFGAGVAIWRGSQEIIGPFEPGLAFSYLLEDGSLVGEVPTPDVRIVRDVRLSGVAGGEGGSIRGAGRTVDVRMSLLD